MNPSADRAVNGAVRLLSVICGLGSVLLLALVPSGAKPLVRLPGEGAWALLWDTAVSLLFFLQHSGMVRRGTRVRLDRLIPSAYYPAVYSIASGVALTLVVVFWQPFGSPPLFVAQTPVRILMRLLSLLSLAGMVWGALALRTFDPLGLRPLRARARGQVEPTPHFTVRGPYCWVRHPLYTCVIVLIWSDPRWSLDHLLFCVLWTAWIWVGAVLEEGDLAREFGAAYRDYRQRVPMLIPWRRPIPPLGAPATVMKIPKSPAGGDTG